MHGRTNGWHRELVDRAGLAYVSLALDKTGKPSISYFSRDQSALKYATMGRVSYMGRKI